jgi:L-galactose dehydrogenase
MRYKTLGRTDLKVSVLGFGAAPLGDEYGTADLNEAARAIDYAIDHGMTFFDVAPYYGRTSAETRLGNALVGKRHKVVLATKCARYDVNGFDFSAERVTRSIDESLQRLRTDYLDIIHVHDVEFGDKQQIVEETLPALAKARAAGKARAIGITGLALKMLREISDEYPVDCLLSYCRYNLLNTELDDELGPFAQSKEIGLINASPLHMRLLCDTGPPAWHPAADEVKEAAREIVQLCSKHGASASRVALQFALEHPYVSSTFVGISSQAEVEENLKAFEGEPDRALLAEIEKIALPVRRMMWSTGRPENH